VAASGKIVDKLMILDHQA